MSKAVAAKIREAAAQAALNAFRAHAKGKAALDREILREMQMCYRDPALREAFRAELVGHYTSPAGQDEIAKAPPWHRNRTAEELAELLLREFPEA